MNQNQNPSTADNEKMQLIAEIVLPYYGVSQSDAESRSRNGDIVLARQMTWAVARAIYKGRISFGNLGLIFNRDHATVMHGIQRVKDEIVWNKRMASEYASLSMMTNYKIGIRKAIDRIKAKTDNAEILYELEKFEKII